MDNTTTYSMNPQPATNKNKTLMVVITIVVLLLLAGGGYYFYQQSQKPAETQSAVDTTEPTAEPSPTEKPIDKSDVKIQVLNGTGTPGEAKKAVDALVKAGYDEDNITTGNAEEYDHTKANIEVKENLEAIAADIKKSLADTFEDIDIDTTELDEDSEYDAIVTTGGELYEAPTTAPTAKPTTSSSSPTTTSGSTTPTPASSLTPTP